MAHHLVLGRLVDYVTGAELADTHDERIRQALAHRLLDELGYDRSELRTRVELPVRAGAYRTTCRLDFVVWLEGAPRMLVRYAPGALVARERSTVAMARLLTPAPPVIAVITNGTDARGLAVDSGRLVGSGLDAIVPRTQLAHAPTPAPTPWPAERLEAEARIVLAFDALECECTGPDAAVQ